MTKKTGNTAAVRAIKLEHLEVEYVDIDSVRPNEYNPNRQSDSEFALLLRSIEEDGMTQPIIVIRATRMIVDGEHRWRACKQLGFKQIPAVFVDMTEEQRRVSTLRHNLARGSHDYALEASVIKDLERLGALDWAQEALQLSDVEVQRMLEDATSIDAFGGAEQFNESWDYSPAGKSYEGGEDSTSSSARVMAAQSPAERAMAMQQQVLREKDVAMAQAHVDAKTRAGRGEWTSLTFMVPSAALEQIEGELERLGRLAPNRRENLTAELRRGLALEYMAVLSSQTPDESVS